MLYYADNIVLLISGESTLSAVQSILKFYSRVSNASVNFEKLVVIAIENVRDKETGFAKLRDREKLIYLEVSFIIEGLVKHNRVQLEILNQMIAISTVVKKQKLSLKVKALYFKLLVFVKDRYIANFISLTIENLKKIKDIKQ